MYRILEKFSREELSPVADGASRADTSATPFSDFISLDTFTGCSRGVIF